MADYSLEQVPHGWSETARFYDAHVASFTAKFARDALDLAGVTPTTRVLDVAAGTGVLALAAAERGAHVLATDFAAGMVDLLRDKALAAGFSPPASPILAHPAAPPASTGTLEAALMDGQALDLPDASFDRAFSILGLMLFPDRARGLRELHRVLVPGGKAAIVAWSKPTTMRALRVFQDALWRALPDLALPPRPPPWLPLTDPAAFAAELHAAGFASVRIHTVAHTFICDAPETAFAWLTGATPALNVLVQHLSPPDRATFEAAFREDVLAAQGEAPFGFEAEAHIAIGLKPHSAPPT